MVRDQEVEGSNQLPFQLQLGCSLCTGAPDSVHLSLLLLQLGGNIAWIKTYCARDSKGRTLPTRRQLVDVLGANAKHLRQIRDRQSSRSSSERIDQLHDILWRMEFVPSRSSLATAYRVQYFLRLQPWPVAIAGRDW